MRRLLIILLVLPVLASITTAQGPEPEPQPRKDLFPLTSGRFGTLGAPNSKAEWEVLGAVWFKAGDCFWQGGEWVAQGGAQPWLLMRPRMYFTGNNRVWNPPPNEPSWGYRDKTKKFIEDNKDRIGLIAMGNSICFADIESGYYDPEEFVTWYHDFREFVHGLNPDIKVIPGDMQAAWGSLSGGGQIRAYQDVYRKRYGEEMQIDAIGLHCYITGNKPPDWAKPEVISVDTFKKKIRDMRTFMKSAGLQDSAFVITEMGVFNHHCEPKLTDQQLIEIMKGAIEFMEGPEGIDQEIGMPSDGYRLVQKWSYSAFPHLVKNGQLTPLGQAYREMVDKFKPQPE